MLTEDFISEGLEAKTKSRMFWLRVGVWWTWERSELDVMSMSACCVSLSSPELLAVWVVQLMFGQLKSPTRMMSRWFLPSCERRFSNF